jgi:hypothetical protein
MKSVKQFALVGAVIGSFSLFSAADADAQVCVGFPAANGQMAAAFAANFPTGGNMVGGEFNYNFNAPMSAFVGLYHNGTNLDTESSNTSAGGGVAFDFAPLTNALPAGISACPTASVVAANVQDLGVLSVPVGVGFGTTMALGETGFSLSPYVIPQVRFMAGGNLDDVDTTARFLLSGGALVNLTPSIYAGATVNRLFVEGIDSEFGLKIGVVF